MSGFKVLGPYYYGYGTSRGCFDIEYNTDTQGFYERIARINWNEDSNGVCNCKTESEALALARKMAAVEEMYGALETAFKEYVYGADEDAYCWEDQGCGEGEKKYCFSCKKNLTCDHCSAEYYRKTIKFENECKRILSRADKGGKMIDPTIIWKIQRLEKTAKEQASGAMPYVMEIDLDFGMLEVKFDEDENIRVYIGDHEIFEGLDEDKQEYIRDQVYHRHMKILEAMETEAKE